MSFYVENFEIVYGAKDNIQALRNKVLELAVQGKLIEQDINDKSASELVKKIQIERDKLVKDGKMKKQKNTSPINEKEIPFQSHSNWKWVRFDDIAFLKKGPFGSSITKSMFVPKGLNTYKVYEQKNAIQKDSTLGDYYITEKKFNELKNFKVSPEDIIVSCAGTIGETYVMPSEIEEGIINQALMKIELSNLIEKDFFLMYFDTILNSYITAKSKGSAMKNIPPLDILKNIPFAVPPHKEQIQIIETYKSYISKIDKLEEKLQKKEHTMKLLPEAVVNAIIKCQNGEELKEQLQFIIKNFETIFQTPDSMQELRTVILQLAIEGKLVPQDKIDEPASELVKKIRAEKDRLVNEGKIKKEKPLPKIDDDEIPFELPDGWVYERLNNVIDVRDGTHDTPKYITEGGYPLITGKDFYNGYISFEKTQYISEDDYLKIIQRSKVDKFDILFSMIGGNIGSMAMVEEDIEIAIKNVALFKYYNLDLIIPKYLFLFLKASSKGIKDSADGGAQQFVSLTKLRNLIIPIPPVNEQHRIIKKVESIMSLIDDMENKLKQKVGLVEKMANV